MQTAIQVTFLLLSLTSIQAGILDHIIDNALKFVPKFVQSSRLETALGKSPPFCNNLDCPTYKVIGNGSNYEIRKYIKSNWVSTSMDDISYSEATSKMFGRLFDYIQGDNVGDQKIAMTAPVINRLIPGPGPACENNFTMSFFVSPKVETPPQPKQSTVFLSKLPELTAYVISFGGFASEKDYITKAAEMAKELEKDGVSYYKNFYYTAGYDSPFRLLHRHNEVWFIGN